MKFLVVGAGAVGGYFGGRLLEKGEDVTFLVRYKRQEQLLDHGLMLESVNGNFKTQPKMVVEGEEGEFDVVLIGTKAYHLEQAVEAVKPFVHKNTVIIPMLNGISHVDMLKKAFSEEQVIGGLCFIESTVTEDGIIKQTSSAHHFTFGELNGEYTDRVKRIEDAFEGANAKVKVSDNILQEMWHKYLFITTMSGVTTLYGQPVGPIRELKEGSEIVKGLFNEIAAIMRAEGAPIADDIERVQYERFMEIEGAMKSSMQRDMEKHAAVEADHLQGYLLTKACLHQLETPILKSIYVNLKLYENDR
ncbi:ketopantoate reductase family protein [Alkalihalophilus marmarensis]|uniref:ketopantoate reductase family protein n=1 Tax=Alkalihalophilus marmarensis TaxID=521377 RepID=UPI002E231FED|nr:ketopantoate reductase family protein [Alkalihalophilus marmarensis]